MSAESRIIRVAATQCAFTGSLDENVARVEGLVREAAATGAQVTTDRYEVVDWLTM